MISRRRSLIFHTLAVLFFFACAIFFTWPLVQHFTTSFPSLDPWTGGDPNRLLWQFDSTHQALSGRLSAPLDRMLYYPNGMNPLAGYDSPLAVLLALPILAAGIGLITSYNIVLLLALICSAVAWYALAYDLTRSRSAAVMTGLAFGFLPLVLIRGMYHINLTFTATIGLFLIAFIRFSRTPTKAATLLLAIAAFLAAVSSGYYFFSCMILLFLGAVTIPIFRSHAKATATAILACLAAGLLGGLPLLFSAGRAVATFDWDYLSRLSFSPIELFVPSPLGIFRAFTGPLYQGLPSVLVGGGPDYLTHSAYLGIVVVGIALWGTRSARHEMPLRMFWWAASGLLLFLALGPVIYVAGSTLPLPFALLTKFSGFSLLRSPHRFAVLGISLLAIPFSFGVRRLLELIRSRIRRYVVLAALGSVLAAERIFIPYPLYTPHISDFYQEIGKDTARYAIADLPISFPGFSEYTFLQTVHKKPIVDGEYLYTAYTSTTSDFIHSVPLLQASICGTETDSRGVDLGRSFTMLREQRVRYLVVHNLYFHFFSECAPAMMFIREALQQQEPEFTDGTITVYRVPD